MIVAVLDQGTDPALEIAGQDVMLEPDTVLHGLGPALDLALGLRVVWRPAGVVHALFAEINRPPPYDEGFLYIRRKYAENAARRRIPAFPGQGVSPR